MAFLASSAWKTGKTCSARFSATGKRLTIRLRVGDHEQFGKPVGIVAGVISEDVGRQRVFGLGAVLFLKDRGERSRQLAPNGTQGFDPGSKLDGIDRHQRLCHLGCPLRSTWHHPGS